MSLTRSLGLWALIGLGGTGVVAGPAVAQAQVGPTVVPSCTGCGIPLMWSPDGRSANLQPSPLAWHVHRGCKLHSAPTPQATMAPLPEGASALGAGMAGAGMAGAGMVPGGGELPGAPGATAADLGSLAAGAGAGGAGVGAGAADFGAQSSGLGGALGGGASSALVMFGDQGPLFGRPRLLAVGNGQMIPRPPVPPLPPGPNPPIEPIPVGAIAKSKVVIPYGRSFKLAENMSPLPQDRLSFAFNYYDGVQEAQNRGLGGLMGGMKVYRYLFTFEKTFLDGLASIGVRESIDTLTATSIYYPGLAGTSTALGDVNVFGKLVLWENLEMPTANQGGFNAAVAPVAGQLQGSVVTGGLSVRVPTGPSNFAGSPFSFSPRDVGIQPFLGYYVSRGNWYLQGFESIDVPTSGENVTMLYSDMGLGYWLYRNQRPGALIRGISPTLEAHVNIPLTNTNLWDMTDLYATATAVNLTYGVNTVIGDRSLLSLGLVTPVTGPKPFDYEVVALFNVYFGSTRRQGRIAAPTIGF